MSQTAKGWRPAAPAMALVAALALGTCPGCRGERYADTVHKFTIGIPPGWTFRQWSGQPCLTVLGPSGEDAGEPNLNVVVPAGKFAALDDLVAVNRSEVSALEDYEPVSEERRRLGDGRDAHALTFRHRAAGESVTVRQLLAVADGRAYIVTATARSDRFAEAEPSFEIALRSFRAGP